ncbi:MAG: transglycosylase SLT domain-containing protein [Legionellaceae bacterium]|nr:transglycosylase SLT domain-containing protein [Legionellaceae bacterium]
MKAYYIAILGVLFSITGCVTAPPRDINNICHIFKQYPDWYREARAVEQRWHIPASIQMAIMHQESKFDAEAKPERQKILWVIPWTRPSSAYGYTQALDDTWDGYKQSRGKVFASRTNFADGVDFIGWYANQAHQRAGISLRDPEALYLAYHEGIGGYQRKTYRRKPWLMRVARKVRTRASIYQAQLKTCQAKLARRNWLKFF